MTDNVRLYCGGCHLAPLKSSGDFTFLDRYKASSTKLNDGSTATYPGLYEVAPSMLAALERRSMPPPTFRTAPEFVYQGLIQDLQSWIKAGKPDGDFDIANLEPHPGLTFSQLPSGLTDGGSCIPAKDLIGGHPEADKRFAASENLPQSLADTDLFTFDSQILAEKGTLSYTVEYPLWSDDAAKIRHIHLPQRQAADGAPSIAPAVLNTDGKHFQFPDNTRFYKTFLKEVKQADGSVHFRRVETRLIVTRQPPKLPLFGTYKWDESERAATLVTAPYRDGTPWKDAVFHLVTDENTGARRTYAIPGRQRCQDCHQGSSSFVLGFTPLQLHRRSVGEAGRTTDPGKSALEQMTRFIEAGVTSGVKSPDDLPKLELQGADHAPNIYAQQLQGYMVGNCAHCHNPDGLAMKDSSVHLDLTAGKLFPFLPVAPSIPTLLTFLGIGGDLSKSLLYLRVTQTASSFSAGGSPMPMHTAGGPDCHLADLMGRWLRSFESDTAAATFTANCKRDSDFTWVEQDFTWPKSSSYVPRRKDWADPNRGMPEAFRSLNFSPRLASIAARTFPTSYWLPKTSQCRFPTLPTPADAPMWAQASHRNWGEVYMQKPGSFYYESTCYRCHGHKADGKSGIAASLLNYSGGAIQVANLAAGLFGNDGKNLTVFDIKGSDGAVEKNLSAQYLVWMAKEGTLLNFPADLSPYLGRGHANMLFALGERCSTLLRARQSDEVDPQMAFDYLVNHDVCTDGNPITPDVGFDDDGAPVDLVAQNHWKDRASYNAAFTIYEYLKNDALRPGGQWQPREGECEKAFPVPATGGAASSPAFPDAVKMLYAVDASTNLQVSIKRPQDVPPDGPILNCNRTDLAEANLSQLNVALVDPTGTTPSTKWTVTEVRLTQTLHGDRVDAEKLCPSVWPEGSNAAGNRGAWLPVIYTSTNVPSGNANDPLIRSLIMSNNPGGSQSSQRFLFKRPGRWHLQIVMQGGQGSRTVSDCIEAPSLSHVDGVCEN